MRYTPAELLTAVLAGAAVGAGVGTSVGASVGTAVGTSVGAEEGVSLAFGAIDARSDSVRDAFAVSVGAGVVRADEQADTASADISSAADNVSSFFMMYLQFALLCRDNTIA